MILNFKYVMTQRTVDEVVQQIEGGKKSSIASTDAEIDFAVPKGDILTLAARAPSGTATVDSVFNWREDF